MAAVRERQRLASIVLWRPMEAADLAYVAALEAQIHAAPWTLGNFRDALAAGYGAVVGEWEGRILAFGVMTLHPAEAQLLNLSVVPDARRQGLGRALLQRFADAARRGGAEQMFLEVRVSNAAAIELYRSAGFEPVGRRTAYYPSTPRAPAEDALVMRLVLADAPRPGDGTGTR
jgi:ribosomal-protein-alanine acetyltransferase